MSDPHVVAALTDPGTVVVVTNLEDGSVMVLDGGWPTDIPPGHQPILAGEGVVAVLADKALARQLGGFGEARAALLGRIDGQGLLAAVAFGQWRARTRFCPRCGGALAPQAGGRVLRCDTGHQVFPRLEPAVIMRVVDARDRILLARQQRWGAGRFSVLAGFVEPGESLEETVRREVAEEVGVPIDGIAYVSSQPWPFPSSLMLAFSATARETALTLQADEIAEAAWFSRADLTAAMQSGSVALPPPLSVAHRLISEWMGGPLRTWSP